MGGHLFLALLCLDGLLQAVVVEARWIKMGALGFFVQEANENVVGESQELAEHLRHLHERHGLGVLFQVRGARRCVFAGLVLQILPLLADL